MPVRLGPAAVNKSLKKGVCDRKPANLLNAVPNVTPRERPPPRRRPPALQKRAAVSKPARNYECSNTAPLHLIQPDLTVNNDAVGPEYKGGWPSIDLRRH